MPEQVKVAIIEDYDRIANDLSKSLRFMGVAVLGIARTFEQAMNDLIPKLALLEVQYVFLDANLSETASKGIEGLLLHQAIKEQSPNTKTIGFSSDPQSYVDIPMGKDKYSIQLVKQIFGL